MSNELDTLTGWLEPYSLFDCDLYIPPEIPDTLKNIVWTSGKALPVHVHYKALSPEERTQEFRRPTVYMSMVDDNTICYTRLREFSEAPEIVRQDLRSGGRRVRERMIEILRKLLGLNWRNPARHEMVIEEFPEIRLDEGILKHGAKKVSKPQEIDVMQIRAGAAIGLERFMKELNERAERLDKLTFDDSLNPYERQKAEIEHKMVVRIIGELSSAACRY